MTKLEELQATVDAALAALAAAKADLDATHRAAWSADWAVYDAACDDYYAARAALDAELKKEKQND